MNAERRIQRVRQVVPAPGAARADWDILCDLGRRMGCETGFDFDGPEQIWDEIRAVWPAAAGISYRRLEAGGLQWPCRDDGDPGTGVLHERAFGHGPRARLRRIAYHPTTERPDADYPFLLGTGRNLHQFNVATMTGRSPSTLLRPTDTLDLAACDAADLGLSDGDMARIESRYGSAVLPAAIDDRVAPGRAFATFHDTSRAINRVTSPHRDRMVGAPEYKITAVRITPA